MKNGGPSLVFSEIMKRARKRKSQNALALLLGKVPHFDLACVGISIHGLSALTFEAVAYLACADVVYCYPQTESHYRLLQLLNESVINMHETLYVRGNSFEPTYDAIIKHVLGTVRNGKRVAYATQGSPAFHCGTCVSLCSLAKREGFSSILVSGVSSFDLLSAELTDNYDLTNIQVYCIPSVMNRRVEINPSVPCFLFDLGRYALPAVREAPRTMVQPRLAALAELLRASYPADHEIILMYARTSGLCETLKTNLLDLVNQVISFGLQPTIFVPAAKMAPSETRG